MCGEQPWSLGTALGMLGSPPRVRGTEDLRRQGGGHRGITPACAGNSKLYHQCNRNSRDHPRVCGEQRNLLRSFPFVRGSPPRVRGTEPVPTLAEKITRITPACAGNRLRRDFLRESAQDHPRVCGEQGTTVTEVPSQYGSPPRVRGTDFQISRLQSANRITPACAGNSCLLRILQIM